MFHLHTLESNRAHERIGLHYIVVFIKNNEWAVEASHHWELALDCGAVEWLARKAYEKILNIAAFESFGIWKEENSFICVQGKKRVVDFDENVSFAGLVFQKEVYGKN